MLVFKIIVLISSLSIIMANYYVFPAGIRYLPISIMIAGLLVALTKVLQESKEKEHGAYV